MSEWIKLDILNRDNLRGHSSKGNQLKAKDGIYWYKADCMGYEGLTHLFCPARIFWQPLTMNR